MADTEIVLKGVTTRSIVAASNALASHASTLSGNYLLVLASTNYQSNLSIATAPTGVGTWVPICSIATASNIMRFASWIAPVTSDGAKTVTVTCPSADSNIDIFIATLDTSGGTITIDGFTTLNDASSPFAHTAVSPAGTKDFLVCAHGQVQFSDTSVYGAAPAGMTNLAAPLYNNNATGFQACYQSLTTSGSTGARSQTGTPTSVTGGAGGMFALRNDAVAAPTGPEPGRFLLAV